MDFTSKMNRGIHEFNSFVNLQTGIPSTYLKSKLAQYLGTNYLGIQYHCFLQFMEIFYFFRC